MITKKVALALFTGLLLSLVLLGVGGPTAQAGKPKADDVNLVAPPPPNDGKVVFSLYNAVDLPGVVKTFQLTNVTALAAPLNYTATPHGDVILAAVNMNLDLRVNAADPDYILSVLEGSWNLRYDTASVINGTSSPQALDQYHTQYAWSNTNLAGIQSRNLGAGVTVAVLDTGVDYNHPDLQGHLLSKGYSPADGGDGMDVNGHGTFVAGLIAWAAPQAKILPVRVLDSTGHGTLSSIINGIQYAVNQGATVLNLSFSTTTSLKSMDKLAKDTADKLGVVFVAAAGNDSVSTPNYPADLGAVVAVSATDSRDYRAAFSNYGDYVTLSAPGVNIYSTYWHGGYAYADGTSFSTPIVAAAAAQYKSLHPGSKGTDVKNALKAAIAKIPTACQCAGIGGRLNYGLIR